MIVRACAPTSLLEIGAWADTALAEHGAAFGCAGSYYANIQLSPSVNKGVTLEGIPKNSFNLEAFFHAAANYFELDSLTARITLDLSPELEPNIIASSAVALAGGMACFAKKMLAPHQVASISHRLYCEKPVIALVSSVLWLRRWAT